MKRILLITTGILVILISLFYFLIPGVVNKTLVFPINVNDRFAVRNMDLTMKSDSLINASGLKLESHLFNEFRILDSNNSFIGSLQVLSRNSDSSLFVWRTEAISENDLPWTRWYNYKLASTRITDLNKLNNNLKHILEEKEQKIKQHIKLTIQQDTIFISKRFNSKEYPSSATLYSHAEMLRLYAEQFIKNNKTSFIYNCMPSNDGYQNMIAIPINKEIPENNEFVIKKMIRANILTMEVSGGDWTIRKAFDDLEYFVRDRGFKSPAIPFIEPIINRNMEADSSKWISKISYPVM